jgi:hypothetical protein
VKFLKQKLRWLLLYGHKQWRDERHHVGSIFTYDGAPGCGEVYVEISSYYCLVDLCRGVPRVHSFIFDHPTVLSEVIVDSLRVMRTRSTNPASIPTFGTIIDTKSVYHKDLVLVVEDHPNYFDVLLPPRLTFNPDGRVIGGRPAPADHSDITISQPPRIPNSKNCFRPQKRLFISEGLAAVEPDVTTAFGSFRHGLLALRLRRRYVGLLTSPPASHQLAWFLDSQPEILLKLRRVQEQLLQWQVRASLTDGNRVLADDGTIGTVASVTNGEAEVFVENVDPYITQRYAIDQLRLRFLAGDSVKIISGQYTGTQGINMHVDVPNNEIQVLLDGDLLDDAPDIVSTARASMLLVLMPFKVSVRWFDIIPFYRAEPLPRTFAQSGQASREK